jgi:hypothetical protein
MPTTWPIKGIFAGTSGGSLGSMRLSLNLQNTKAKTATTREIMIGIVLPACNSSVVMVAFEVMVAGP